MDANNTLGTRAVLTLAHVVGMIDMVALPLWVGTLMQHYGYSAPQAGMAVTMFLVAAAVTSLLVAPRLNRLPGWIHAGTGFALGATAFLVIALQAPLAPSAMAWLNSVGGVGIGCALSLTHGRIGRSGNPHRLFATVNIALGVFAIGFLAGVPPLISRFGPQMLFLVFATAMTLSAGACLFHFPATDATPAQTRSDAERLPRSAWFVIAAITCLTLNQSMVFAFVERIGAARAFGADRVQWVLIALGFVNLLPGALAAVLQRRVSPLAVGLAGPIIQAALAVVLSSATTYPPFAMAAAVYVAVVIFTHTFLFGLLSRLDPSGRTVAATPAMMMLGSCTGPAIGGAVVQAFGHAGLGWVACVVALVSVGWILSSVRAMKRSAPAWPQAGQEALP